MLSQEEQDGQPFMTAEQMAWAFSQVDEVLSSQFGIVLEKIGEEMYIFPEKFLTHISLNKKLSNIPSKFCRLGKTPDGKETHGWAFEYEESPRKKPAIVIRYFNSEAGYSEYKRLNITNGQHHGQGICCSECARGIKRSHSQATSRPATRPTSSEEKAANYQRRLNVARKLRAQRKGKRK